MPRMMWKVQKNGLEKNPGVYRKNESQKMEWAVDLII